MADFYCLTTSVGNAKLSNALALGLQVILTHLAVGDGNGAVYNPAGTQTALAREVYRAPINAILTDPQNPSWLIVECVIPANFGGWYVREAGIFDEAGDMIAIAKMPESYKAHLDSGAGDDLYVRLILQHTNVSAVTLKIDPSIVLATRSYVDQQRAAHEASRNHPYATQVDRGFIRIATAGEAVTATAGDLALPPSGALALMQSWGFATGAAPNTDGLDGVRVTSVRRVDTPATAGLPVASLVFTMARGEGLNLAACQIAYGADDVVRMRRLNNDTWTGWVAVATREHVATAIAEAATVKTGTVVWHVNVSATIMTAGGYLPCNGAAVGRDAYADLFSLCGTTFGAGDGATTFNLPDLRGVFIRGFDNGRGLDPGRVIGSFQSHEVGAHAHTVPSVYLDAPTNVGQNRTVSLPPGQFTTDITANGGAETRPVNVALMPWIKF